MDGEENKAISFTRTLGEWLKEYSTQREHGAGAFLKRKFCETLAAMDEAEAEAVSKEIIEEVQAYESTRQEIAEAMEQGLSKEEWISEKLMEGVEGLPVEEQTEVLGTIYEGFVDAVDIEEELDETEETEETENLPLEGRRIAPMSLT